MLRVEGGFLVWRLLRRIGALGSLGLAVLFLLLAVAAQIGRPGSPLDAISHFTPWIGLAALLAAGLGFACGLRLRGLFPALAGLFLCGWIVAPEWLAGTAQSLSAERRAEAPTLKILAMNVWRTGHGLDAAEALIRREQPDIIMLQEVRGDWQLLAQRIADEYGHMAYCLREYWCDTVVLSRLAFVEDITPESAFIAAARMKLPARLGGETIDVVGVHMPWPLPARRQARAMELLGAMAQTLNPDTAIVAGDFNSTPWSNSLKRLDAQIPFPRRTHGLFTFPTPDRAFTKLALRAQVPLIAIDQVYAGARWRVVEVRRGARMGSDHYPVIAVLTMDVPAAMAGPAPTPSALRGSSQADAAVRP
ncbi:MAG: endonuclease/exonuclease/phosphatase family protein [Hyphomonadaceae bacterium]|nr:endonuclease/exonuclease/phosphatase family protein [Hyphomonadaceae bacterium]